jgi:hypothetical protein
MEAPKYVVMHFTTGTQISSTINWFQQPGTASTHLLIGRDGRVIQFVPFNRSAFHVGYGYWEGEGNLNRKTIGIELDNAGYLRKESGLWFRKKTLIPTEQVREETHWKEFGKRGWEMFPPVQLQVALDIVKALVKHYDLKDILGHDMVNLINRLDPGPLFPMPDWLQQIFGREEPAFLPHVIADKTGKTAIFSNPEGDPPSLPGPSTTPSGKKKKGSKKKPQRRKNKPAPPPAEMKGSPLPNDTLVRILEKRGTWTLVFVLPDSEKKIRWMEGWVKSAAVKPKTEGVV